jgi:hypothetical protein
MGDPMTRPGVPPAATGLAYRLTAESRSRTAPRWDTYGHVQDSAKLAALGVVERALGG